MSDSTNYTGRVYNDPAYRIAKSMYIAIGGDASITFENTDEIYEAINGIYAESGGRIAIEPLNMILSSNGPYTFNDEDITGYKPVNIEVDVAQKWTDEQVTQLQQDSYNNGYSEGETKGYNNGYTAGNTDGYTDGYADGVDDGADEQKALLESITITENGTYNREDGWNEVVVEIETDGGGDGAGFDYTPIGYEQSLQNMLNQTTQNHIAYAKERLDYFNSRNTIEARRFFAKDTQIVFAPILDLNTRIHQNTSYTILDSMFNGATNLEVFPGIIGRPYASASSMFENCKKLRYVGHFDTSTLKSMSYMFNGCESLTTVPLFDTSNVTSMNYMFSGCTSLTTVPQFDTSSVLSMSYMFNGCESLTTVPLFDTSNVTSMNYMFQKCSSLTTVPQFDTSSVLSMNYMFSGCTSLTTVPQFDTSSVTKMDYMFQKCSSLTTVPQFDTSSVLNMNYMFDGCSSLQTAPPLDASKVTIVSSMFSSCINLTDVGGLINLGMQSNLSTPTSRYSGPFYNCKKITRESVLNIFNGLYDRASAGYSNLKLIFEADVINRLTEDDIAIATNKGWTISQ